MVESLCILRGSAPLWGYSAPFRDQHPWGVALRLSGIRMISLCGIALRRAIWRSVHCVGLLRARPGSAPLWVCSAPYGDQHPGWGCSAPCGDRHLRCGCSGPFGERSAPVVGLLCTLRGYEIALRPSGGQHPCGVALCPMGFNNPWLNLVCTLRELAPRVGLPGTPLEGIISRVGLLCTLRRFAAPVGLFCALPGSAPLRWVGCSAPDVTGSTPPLGLLCGAPFGNQYPMWGCYMPFGEKHPCGVALAAPFWDQPPCGFALRFTGINTPCGVALRRLLVSDVEIFFVVADSDQLPLFQRRAALEGGFFVFLRDHCLRLGCAEVGGGLRQQSSSSIT